MSADGLAGNHVDIWTVASGPEAAGRLHCFLAPEELERAARFHRHEDAERYVVAHGALRLILARYLGAEPLSLRFEVGVHGKPKLAIQPGWPDIQFNLSHSGQTIACAFAQARAVGIDVERIDADFAQRAIAESFFSAAEVRALKGVPAEAQCDAFFALWTRKEAYIKGVGSGLWHPLDGFDVSSTSRDQSALLASRIDKDATQRWVLRDLDVGAGYAAALAIERRAKTS